MNYFLLALTSAIILGTHNYFVPRVIELSYTKESFILHKEIFAVIALFIFMLWNPFELTTPGTIREHPILLFFLTIAGGAATLMLYYYYKGLDLGKKGPVSAVVYSYIGGIIIIGYIFAITNFNFFGTYKVQTPRTYLFVLLIITGILLLFTGKTNGKKVKNQHKAMKNALIAMGLYVLMFIAYGSVPAMIGGLAASAYGRAPLIPFTAILIRTKKQRITFLPPKRKRFVVLLMGLLVAASMICMSLAFEKGDKGIVAAIYGANPLITWIIALVKDKNERKITVLQATGVLLTIAGILLLSLHQQ